MTYLGNPLKVIVFRRYKQFEELSALLVVIQVVRLRQEVGFIETWHVPLLQSQWKLVFPCYSLMAWNVIVQLVVFTQEVFIDLMLIVPIWSFRIKHHNVLSQSLPLSAVCLEVVHSNQRVSIYSKSSQRNSHQVSFKIICKEDSIGLRRQEIIVYINRVHFSSLLDFIAVVFFVDQRLMWNFIYTLKLQLI